jgi:hypothetical protein
MKSFSKSEAAKHQSRFAILLLGSLSFNACGFMGPCGTLLKKVISERDQPALNLGPYLEKKLNLSQTSARATEYVGQNLGNMADFSRNYSKPEIEGHLALGNFRGLSAAVELSTWASAQKKSFKVISDQRMESRNWVRQPKTPDFLIGGKFVEYKSVSPLIVSEVYRDSNDELWLSAQSLATKINQKGELKNRLEESITRSLFGHLKKASDQLESAEKARDHRAKFSNGILWVDIETSHLEGLINKSDLEEVIRKSLQTAINTNWDQGHELSGIRGLAIRLNSQDPSGSRWLHWEQDPKTGWIQVIDPVHGAKTFGDLKEFMILTRRTTNAIETKLQLPPATQNLEVVYK